jgi:dihydrofolate reductase
MVDFITSLDGYGAAEGWPGWWGLEGPEYLDWLGEQAGDEHTVLMGANTYRLMSGFADAGDFPTDEEDSLDQLTRVPKVVFSSSLEEPLAWANTELERGHAPDVVNEMKQTGSNPLRTIGSLALCRSLLEAGLVDRFRVVVVPVITGKTGYDRIYDSYPDIALELVDSRSFDGRTQMLEYVPTVLTDPPGLQPDSPH